MKVEAEQLGTFEFELKDADGKVIETVKNDEKGAISFSKLSYTEKDAGKTFTYTVKRKAPIRGRHLRIRQNCLYSNCKCRRQP